MILAAFFGASLSLSLIVPVAVDYGAAYSPELERDAYMSLQQKRAMVRPLVLSTTECIARTVSADPRFSDLIKVGNVNDLIVNSVPRCLDAVRTMIDTYDRLFGRGAGETFFVGPYLDGLPAAVNALVKSE